MYAALHTMGNDKSCCASAEYLIDGPPCAVVPIDRRVRWVEGVRIDGVSQRAEERLGDALREAEGDRQGADPALNQGAHQPLASPLSWSAAPHTAALARPGQAWRPSIASRLARELVWPKGATSSVAPCG